MKLVTPHQSLMKKGFLTLSCLNVMYSQAQFTSGNLTVLQAGDGSASLTNTGNVIVLKEFSSAGIVTYSMAVPSGSISPLIMSGSASSEGFLSLSGDGKYLVFGGYAMALPNAAPLPGATASTINRGIGLVGGQGLATYSRIATSTSFFTGSNIRAAAAADNANVWGAGGNQGVNYFGNGTPVTIQNTKTNLRALAVFNGQLYCSSQVASGTPGNRGIFSIGSGTPTSTGQIVTTVINTGTGSQPAQFYFNNANTICYVADQRNSAGGGIQKWVQSAGSWSLVYTLPTGTTAVGAIGVTADFSGTNPVVYATTSESHPNRLIAVTDLGANSTATTLASSTATGTIFRGLAFSPCSLPVVTASSSAASACAGETLALSASVAGAGAYSYSWTGAGQLSGTATANAILTTSISDVYTIAVSNNCGVSTETVNVIVNQLPAVSAGSITICNGQSATLIATGADSYSWSNGSSSDSIIVTPTTTTDYTITGTSSAGCTQSISTQVAVSASPVISLSSQSICLGSAATLMASGVNSYTWNTGNLTNSIVVSPSVSTIYTVSGGLTGCTGLATDTALVSVLTTSLSIAAGTLQTCGGSPVTLTVSGASTYTWDSGINSETITVVPIVTSTYSVSGTGNNGCAATASAEIIISPAPELTVTAIPAYLCENFDITSAMLSVSGASSYSWAGGATGNTLAVNQFTSTIYTVTGMIDANCLSFQTFTLYSYDCEGITNYSNDAGIRLYPNPASDHLQIEFENTDEKTLELIDSKGQVLYFRTTSVVILDVNTSVFPKGVYEIRLRSKTGKASKILILE